MVLPINGLIVNAAQTEWNFGYTGSVQTFTAPYSGKYTIELYGASGGGAANSVYGGTGGYTRATIKLQKGTNIYLQVGQQGSMGGSASYNGGGASKNKSGSGGGATSVTTTKKNELKDFKSTISEVLLVAGGGGGAGSQQRWESMQLNTSIVIGQGGGEEGTGVTEHASPIEVDGVTYQFDPAFSIGGNVGAGYQFGTGEPSTGGGGGAGGGGWYGGTSSQDTYTGSKGAWMGGGGGSGRIGIDSDYDFENTITTTSSHIGNGSVKIKYNGKYQIVVNILLKDRGTFKGNSGASYKYYADCDSDIDFPDVAGINGSIFKKYDVISGGISIDSNSQKAHTGMRDAVVDVVYSADLNLTTLQKENNVTLRFNDDTFPDLEFEVQRCYDNESWASIDEDGNTVSIESSITLDGNVLNDGYTVSMSGVYYIEAYGAMGGSSRLEDGWYNGFRGMSGAKCAGYVYLVKGDTLMFEKYNGGVGARDSLGSQGGTGGQGIGIKLNGEIILAAGGGGGGGTYHIYSNGETHGNASYAFRQQGNNSSTTGSNGVTGYGYGGMPSESNRWQPKKTGGGGGGYPYGGATIDDRAWGASGACAGLNYAKEGVVYQESSMINSGASYSGQGADLTSVKAILQPVSVSYRLSRTDLSVALRDVDAPQAPSNATNYYVADTSKVTIKWNEVVDYGTTNYFRVLSWQGKNLVNKSSVRSYEYTSGFKQFVYTVNTNSGGYIYASGNWYTCSTGGTVVSTEKTEAIINDSVATRWLHIASVDNSGNISETYTYKVNSIRYTLSINPNGGTFNGSTETFNYELATGQEIVIQAPEKVDYKFICWVPSRNGIDMEQNVYDNSTMVTMPNYNITLTAYWMPLNCNISYDVNNETINKYGDEVTTTGKGSIGIQQISTTEPDQNIKYNKSNSDIGDIKYTKVGYVFNGWNTQVDGTGDAYEEGQAVNYYNLKDKYGLNFTLYAQWEPITYQIRFNSNDDSKGDWNEADSYFQTVTNNGSTVDTIRYDQWINLVPNKFTRKSPILLSNNVEINKDYEFIGWGNAKLQSTASYTDKQKIRNFRDVTEAGKIYDVYALWKRPIALTFNMNGGKYNGESEEKELRGCVYNSRYSYEFNITNGKTAQQTGLQSIQSNTIDAYGTYDSNGINMKYTKVVDGVEYRFLGWSLTPTATEPDISLCPYNSNRKSTYTIYNNTTLYAVWEPVLSINFTLQRTLGNLKFTDGASPISTIHSISAVTPNPQVSTIIKPGEQGQYIIETKNEDLAVKVAFDTKITDIYTHEGTWQDSLNPSTSEDLVTGQVHGLDRKYTTRSSYESRKFYIPQYLGTEQSYATSKGVNVYNMMCTISQPSYYYDKVYGKEEDIEIIGTIYISPNKTYSNTEIPSVLDELRSKLKIVLK